MSVIEDSRKVLQDFIAPELRAVDARLTALERKVDGLERQIDRRFDQMMSEIGSMKKMHELEVRMSKYETQLSSAQENRPQPKPESEAA